MSAYLETSRVMAYLDSMCDDAMTEMVKGKTDAAAVFATLVVVRARIAGGYFDWSGEGD